MGIDQEAALLTVCHQTSSRGPQSSHIVPQERCLGMGHFNTDRLPAWILNHLEETG